MTITFFNNWKTGIEFILVEMSFNNDAFTVALLGFGMVIIFNHHTKKDMEKENKITSIDFPRGKINLPGGYSGEFSMEFYNKSDTKFIPTTPLEVSKLREEFAEAFRKGDGAWHPNFELIADFWISKLTSLLSEVEREIGEERDKYEQWIEAGRKTARVIYVSKMQMCEDILTKITSLKNEIKK